MLSFVMFINGMCIMVLEMAGARLIAPWLGTSIVVWTSLIGVILLSLSLGYVYGGKLADKHLCQKPDSNTYPAAVKVLGQLFFISAVMVSLTGFSHNIILKFVSSYVPSLHFAALFSVAILFALPSLFCGMISPYATRVAIHDTKSSGSIIGKLNAIGTVGSIVGTFLGGFILVAWFSTHTIILGVATCLLITSFFVDARPIIPKVVLGCCLFGACLWQYSIQSTSMEPKIIETPYNTIKIFQGAYTGAPAIFLQTDPGAVQGGMYLDLPYELMLPYTKFFTLPTALKPNASRILMLGGGAYSIPSWLLSASSPVCKSLITLAVVEIDPGMTQLAATYFGLPVNDPRLAIYHEDARTFLNKQSADTPPPKYDLIFTDLFNSAYSIPFQAGTIEAAQKIEQLLTDDGILMMNIISAIEGEQGRLFRSIYHAFHTVFPELIILPVHIPDDGKAVQNIMLVASKKPLTISNETLKKLPHNAREAYHAAWTKPIAKDIPALTDSYAPVDRYLNYATAK